MDSFKRIGVLKHVIISSIVHLIAPTLILRFYPLFSNQHILYPEQLPLKYDQMLYFHNNYQYQPNHAFMYGFVLLNKAAKSLFGYSLGMVALLVVNKLAYLSAGLDLYQILQSLVGSTLQNDKQAKENKLVREKVPYQGLLFFLYNPAGIFFHSVYTESIFSFLTFKAVKYLLLNENFNSHPLFSKVKVVSNLLKANPLILPVFLLFLASSIKSNGLLLSAVIGLQIIKGVFVIKQPIAWTKNVMKGALILFVLTLPYLIHSTFTYYNICVWSKNQSDLCNKTVFGIYGAVQQKFWEVGFLKHYEMKNVLFIALGSFAIIFGGIGLVFYSKKFDLRQSGLYLSFVFLWVTTAFFANVQPSTRFFCAHPFFYYILAKIGMKAGIIKFWAIAYWTIGIYFFTLRFIWV